MVVSSSNHSFMNVVASSVNTFTTMSVVCFHLNIFIIGRNQTLNSIVIKDLQYFVTCSHVYNSHYDLGDCGVITKEQRALFVVILGYREAQVENQWTLRQLSVDSASKE